MSIVEFAEKLLGYELSSWQKIFLTKCYEYISQNKKLYFIPPKGNIRYMPMMFQYITIIYCLNEHELNKEEKDD